MINEMTMSNHERAIAITVLLSAVLGVGCRGESGGVDTATAAGAISRGDAELVSTKLVVRLRSNGEAELVEAIEQPGRAVQPTVFTGDYVYEAVRGEDVIAVGSFADPFEQHPILADDQHDAHATALPVDEVVIRILLPGIAANSPDFSLRFHRLTRAPDDDYIDGATVRELHRSGALRPVAQLEAPAMEPVLRAARRLPPQVATIEQ